MELWKVIEEFPRYSVSSEGRVMNNKTGRILKQSRDSNGYAFVCLFDGAKHTKTVHMLVAKLFIPNPLGLKCVNHKNGNKTDPRAENLEWCTHKENRVHAVRELKLYGGGKRKAVACLETGIVYPTARAAAMSIGVSDMMISKCLYGKIHTAGGYHWKYDVYRDSSI